MKKCTKCKEKLPNAAFGKSKREKGGLLCSCRKCGAPGRKTSSAWRVSEVGKRAVLKYQLYLKYKLTLEDYDHMLEKQKGVCAVCGKPETCAAHYGGVRRLAVDHDHKTGKVRGLLCALCNQALGCVGDSKERLLQLAIYLEQSAN